jgi:hypothetical protein
MSVSIVITVPIRQNSKVRCVPLRQGRNAGPFVPVPSKAIVIEPGESKEIVVNMMAAFHLHEMPLDEPEDNE